MIHTYIDKEKNLEELIKLYREKKGQIIIAFNYNTVHFNEMGAGENYELISKVLDRLQSKGATLICYYTDATTTQEIEKKLYLINLKVLDIVHLYIAPTADVIVDQRCGLSQVYHELVKLSEIDL